MKYYKCKNHELLEKKLKVGDRVKIISLEKVNSIRKLGYDFMFGFNRTMLEYCGKEFVITYKKMRVDVMEQKNGIDNVAAFKLENGGGFLYCVEMFDLTNMPVLLENE